MRSIRSFALPVIALALLPLALVACTSVTPGWTYAPAPSATPIPSIEPSAEASAAPSAPASAAPSAPASAAPSASGGGGGGTVLEISATTLKFDTDTLAAPADQPFRIHFVNNDPGVLHNVAIHEGSPTGPEVFRGEIFAGVGERTYDVSPLAAGTYGFVCSVHPSMTGTLTAG